MFTNNNLFLNSMLGNEPGDENYAEYLAPTDSGYTISLDNAKIVSNSNNKIEVEKVNSSIPGNLTFSITNTKDQELYMDLNNNIQEAVYLYVNGNKVSTYGGPWNNGIISLGYFKAGEQVTVKLQLVSNSFVIDHIQFYGLNTDEFANSIETLKDDSIKDLKIQFRWFTNVFEVIFVF